MNRDTLTSYERAAYPGEHQLAYRAPAPSIHTLAQDCHRTEPAMSDLDKWVERTDRNGIT